MTFDTSWFGKEYQSWLGYVAETADVYWRGAARSGFSLSSDEPGAVQAVAAAASKKPPGRVVICAPHPDDEVLFGALPLRLALEQGDRVSVVTITSGSNRDRQAARLEEAAAACAVLGFELIQAGDALAPVSPCSRGQDPAGWQRKIEFLAGIFTRLSPDLVLYPHDLDGHHTHIGTHHLVHAALARHTADRGEPVMTAECEYWHPMTGANLLLGVGNEQVALLLTALAMHRGEVSRNPYHLREPARLIDSVRRGAEVMQRFGQRAPEFLFGVLYRLGRFAAGVSEPAPAALIISPAETVALAGLARGFPPGAVMY